jgi:hypothetical protein
LLVVQRVFRAKRTNLHEKYDYSSKSLELLPQRTGEQYSRAVGLLDLDGLPLSGGV